MKSVIELVRVSTENQAALDRAGVPAQREVNAKTAAQYRLEIVRTIEIVDVSGALVLLAPEMQELLRLMEQPVIAGVVAREFSRLMRPEKFSDFILLQHFVDTNTILYLPDGPVDFSSKQGRMFGGIKALMAGMERQEILDRMRDAKESMRRAGKHPAGSHTLPYGVGYSKERGWFYTEDAEKVKRLFTLFLAGNTSYQELSQLLNLPRTNVKFLLQNRIYTGWKIYSEKRDTSAAGYVAKAHGRQGYRKKVARPANEVISKKVLEGIISEDDFAAAQHLIENKRQRVLRVTAHVATRYTYRGFLNCGVCGELLYTCGYSRKHEFYVCKSRNTRERKKRAQVGMEPCANKHMVREKLEAKLDTLFGKKLLDRDFLESVLRGAELMKQATATVPSASNVQRKLEELKRQRERVLDAFFEGLIGKEERDARLQTLKSEKDVFDGLPQEVPNQNGHGLGIEDLSHLLEPLADWPVLSREQRRSILSALCPQVSVDRYRIRKLQLNLPRLHTNEDSPSRMEM